MMKNSIRLSFNRQRIRFLLCCPAFALFFLLLQSTAGAQSRWQATFRPAVKFPTEKIGGNTLKTGIGLEGSVAYRFLPHLAVYTGWGWNHFSQDAAITASDFEETGYSFGLQFVHPIAKSNISYLLNGGAVYNHIEVENDKGEIIHDSGHGWGWQAEGGLAINIGPRFTLQPTVRYRSLSREISFGNGATSADLRYLSLGVGIGWKF